MSTSTVERAPADPAGGASAALAPQPLQQVGQDAAVLSTLVLWATLLTWGWGGRDGRVLSVSAVALLVALVMVRPWRVLSLPYLLLPMSVGVAACLVVATAPTGWAGRHDAASYVFASQLFVVVLAWARDTNRRLLLLITVAAAGGMQFAQGWLAWWGKADPEAIFQGTFYWHNQVGIFLAIGALAGFGVLCFCRYPVAPLGWVVAPIAASGVIFTTSRGSQIGLGLGLALLAAACLCSENRLRSTLRLLASVFLTALVSFLLTGPPFFAQRSVPGASTAARGESFTGNGVQRIEDWRRAWEIFLEWPLTGGGFLSFRSAAAQVTELRDGVSVASAHNGFLQALADGGLVLAVPLWTATVVVLVLAARALPRALRTRDMVTAVGAILLLVAVLHSGMDFDWSYPSLLALFALCAALALGSGKRAAAPTARAAAVVCCLSVALVGFAAVAGWSGGYDRNVTVVVE